MCPPGYGFDITELSAQEWSLIAPLARLIHELKPTNTSPHSIKPDSPLVEFLPAHLCANNFSFSALQRLFIPTLPKSKSPLPLWDTALFTQRPNSSPSRFETLPSEITRHIMSHLTPLSLIPLGLTSQRLWAHAVAHTHSTYRRSSTLAPWANTPLACVGTWLTELPPALEVAMPEFEDVRRDFQDRQRRGERWLPRSAERLWLRQARKEYGDVRACEDLEGEGLQTFDAVVPWRGPPFWLRSSMRACLRREWAMGLEEGSGLWLRNHTSGEVVKLVLRAGKEDAGAYTAVVRGEEWLTLDVLLMMKIAWTGATSRRREPSRPFWDKMKKGPWAGHCFDVVGENPAAEGKWVDITETVVAGAKAFMEQSKKFLYGDGGIPTSSSSNPGRATRWAPILTPVTYPDTYPEPKTINPQLIMQKQRMVSQMGRSGLQ